MVCEKKQKVPYLVLWWEGGGRKSSNIILLEERAVANFGIITMGLLVKSIENGVEYEVIARYSLWLILS